MEDLKTDLVDFRLKYDGKVEIVSSGEHTSVTTYTDIDKLHDWIVRAKKEYDESSP